MQIQQKKKTDTTLQIYKKYLDMIYYVNDITRKYPKHERFVLVQETKQSTLKGIRCIIFASKEFSKQGKLKYLNELDALLKIQKVYIRMAFKYQYITQKNYETWSNMLTDVCNLLGGWIKSCLTK